MTKEFTAAMADRMMQDFYFSSAYDPKAGRPADVVKAAIAFAMTATRRDDAEQVAGLQKALVDHNDALRSAAQVADREGAETNWLSFRGHVHWILAEHHDISNTAREALSPSTAAYRAATRRDDAERGQVECPKCKASKFTCDEHFIPATEPEPIVEQGEVTGFMSKPTAAPNIGEKEDSGNTISRPLLNDGAIDAPIKYPRPTLVNRLINRALARLSLKRPSKLDQADADLDYEAATAIRQMQIEIERLRDKVFDLTNELEASNKFNNEWQDRATTAEAQVRELREALEKVRSIVPNRFPFGLAHTAIDKALATKEPSDDRS